MSYILDALKKAEQKRHLAAKVPTLATVHRTAAPTASGHRVWPWIAAAVILVNGGALIWLLRPAPTAFTGGSSDSTRPPAPSTPLPAPQPAPTRQVEPATPVTPPDKAATVAVAPPPAPHSRHVSAPRQPVPDHEPTRARPVETKTTAPAAPAPAASRAEMQKPADGRAAPPMAAAKAPATASAPPAAPSAAAPGKAASAPEKPATQAVARGPVKPVQQGTGSAPTSRDTQAAPQDIQKMKLQMLVYSDVPSERLVFINDHKYLEGGSIDGNLVVESITPEGAVLSYQGKRFLLRQ